MVDCNSNLMLRGPVFSLVLLGRRRAGKSSAGNTILGRRAFECGTRSTQSERRLASVAGRRLAVVDTPGWSRFGLASEERVRREMLRSIRVLPPGLLAFLLVIPVDSFGKRDRHAVEEHLDLLGEGVWSRAVVLFTWGDELGRRNIAEHIEKEGRQLQEVLERCGNRYHVFNNKDRTSQDQVIQLLAILEQMFISY